MQDRIPTPGQEGRVLITPENGGAPYYATIEMADNPTQPGTPWSMETVLQQATATALGLTQSDPVPNDAFSQIASLLSTLLGNSVQLEYGSYAGTGSRGYSGNPLTITTSKPFRLIMLVSRESTDSSDDEVFYPIGAYTTRYSGTYNYTLYTQNIALASVLTTSYQKNAGFGLSYGAYSVSSGISYDNIIYSKISADGRTLSWYASGDADAGNAANSSSSIYHWIAITEV